MTAAATTLILFGATGDLAQRMLLPSLAVLAGEPAAGQQFGGQQGRVVQL